MKNVELTIEDGRYLNLRIDLDQTVQPTRRGHSMLIASTFGNLQIWHDGRPHPAGIKLNLSVFRQLSEEEKREAEKAENSGEDRVAALLRKLGNMI